jgi:hypothetical protein
VDEREVNDRHVELHEILLKRGECVVVAVTNPHGGDDGMPARLNLRWMVVVWGGGCDRCYKCDDGMPARLNLRWMVMVWCGGCDRCYKCDDGMPARLNLRWMVMVWCGGCDRCCKKQVLFVAMA